MWHPPTTGLAFALQHEQWVSIREVPKGLACNCYCPHCGSQLMAKKGKKQRHHFAHYQQGPCTGAGETMLHLLAKHLLAQHLQLRTPAVFAFPKRHLQHSRTLCFSAATPEHDFGPFRTDVWLTQGRFRLAIELSVSHPCPAAKIYYYVRQGIPALEIDVRELYTQLLALGKGDSLTAFRNALIKGDMHRRWLFHPLQHAVEYRERKQSTRRKVQHSQQGTYHHYHVYGCPRHLRFVRGGFRGGQSYARVFQDCLHCSRCRGIDYARQWVGYKQLPQAPVEVYCWDEDEGRGDELKKHGQSI